MFKINSLLGKISEFRIIPHPQSSLTFIEKKSQIKLQTAESLWLEVCSPATNTLFNDFLKINFEIILNLRFWKIKNSLGISVLNGISYWVSLSISCLQRENMIELSSDWSPPNQCSVIQNYNAEMN